MLIVVLALLASLGGVHGTGREVAQRVSVALGYNATEEDVSQCSAHVAVGGTPDAMTGLLALLQSIDAFSRPLSPTCVYIFTTGLHMPRVTQVLTCLRPRLRSTRLFQRLLDESKWAPAIRSSAPHMRFELLSPYNWFRFYLRPSDISGMTRVIYMSTDVIVQGDLSRLYNHEHGIVPGVHVASAVYQPEQMLSMFLCKRGCQMLAAQVTGDIPSINAGVMVMDLKEWRRQGVLRRWNELLLLHNAGWKDGKNNDECLWNLASQPELQLVDPKFIASLDRRWNVQCLRCADAAAEWEKRKQRAAERSVLHWNDELKPWLARTPGVSNRSKRCDQRTTDCLNYLYVHRQCLAIDGARRVARRPTRSRQQIIEERKERRLNMKQERADAICYAQRYPDVQKALCADASADGLTCQYAKLLDHFETLGRDESRIYHCAPPLCKSISSWTTLEKRQGRDWFKRALSCHINAYGVPDEVDLFNAFCTSNNNSPWVCDFHALHAHLEAQGQLQGTCSPTAAKRSVASFSSFGNADGLLSRPVLSVIVLTFRNTIKLRLMLESVSRQQTNFPYEVVIADNGCEPGIKSLVRNFQDKMAETNTSVRYVPICSNVGYAAGNNAGAASASTSPTGHLLFLNDDIELMPRFIQSLYELMATRRPIAAGAPGAVGCKIVSQNGASLLEAGSIMWSDGSALGYGRGGRPDAPEFAFARPVDYISGATLAFSPFRL